MDASKTTTNLNVRLATRSLPRATRRRRPHVHVLKGPDKQTSNDRLGTPGHPVGSGQDFFRAPLQIFFFIFRGLGWIFFCYFFFTRHIYITRLRASLQPSDSRAQGKPYNPPYEVGAPKRQSGQSVYKGIEPRLIYRIRYYSGGNTGYRYHGSKTPNNTLAQDGLRSPPPSPSAAWRC